MSDTNDIRELTRLVRDFADRRDWAQFHDPKNLAMALASEVGELNALLRWVRNEAADEEVKRQPMREKIRSEIGDIGILLLELCSRAEIDLGQSVRSKLELNGARYPESVSRGRAERPATE